MVQNKVATLRENELPYPLLVANTVKPLSSAPPIKRTPSIKRTLSLVPKRTSDISISLMNEAENLMKNYGDVDNFSYGTKAEINNCFIIHSEFKIIPSCLPPVDSSMLS